MAAFDCQRLGGPQTEQSNEPTCQTTHAFSRSFRRIRTRDWILGGLLVGVLAVAGVFFAANRTKPR